MGKTTFLTWSFITLTCATHAARGEVHKFERDDILGTNLEVRMVCASDTGARDAYQKALDEIDRLSKIFDWRNPESELSRLAKQPAGTNTKVSDELFAVLGLAKVGHKLGGGHYSVFSKALSDLWKNAETSHEPPDAVQLAEVCRKIKQADAGLVLDGTDKSVSMATPMPMDLDSVAKGFIIDRCLEVVMAGEGVTSALVNIGGDVATAGAGHPWPVEIKDPAGGAALKSFRLQHGALATSGSEHRYFTINGKHYSHIIDAATGQPVDKVASASVLARDAARADVLATVACLLGPDEAVSMIERIPSCECLVVDAQGGKHYSRAWRPEDAPARDAVASGSSLPKIKISWRQNNSTSGKKFKRHFTAVWIEDAKKSKVRDLALWYKRKEAKHLKALKTWWTKGGRKTLSDKNVLASISEATRRAGSYDLVWDHKDNEGNPLPPGEYFVNIEVNREHGPGNEHPTHVRVPIDTRRTVHETGKDFPELDHVTVETVQ